MATSWFFSDANLLPGSLKFSQEYGFSLEKFLTLIQPTVATSVPPCGRTAEGDRFQVQEIIKEGIRSVQRSFQPLMRRAPRYFCFHQPLFKLSVRTGIPLRGAWTNLALPT